MRILVLNGGSSSFKCAVYEFSGDDLPASVTPPVWKDSLPLDDTDLAAALEPVLSRAGTVDVVGHRIVQGGPEHRTSSLLTTEVRAAIAAQAEIAPSHNRLELTAIQAVDRTLPASIPQVAVFDTAFHTTLPPAAYVYPGPYEWFTNDGIRRYGFHGISYQYASRRASEISGRMPARLVVCHLGNGASVCAIQDGKSVDTAMGFTPLEGLMMGSRSGSIDPGIIVYLMRHHGYTADQLDRALNRESGLLGISGISSDMRAVLEAAAGGNSRAQLALDIYIHRLVREVGSMIAVLGGLDALVFTGGVGENSALVRERTCRQLAFLGDSIPILVIHAEEEWEIARECWRQYHNSKQGTLSGKI